jgi:hypothetical protein
MSLDSLVAFIAGRYPVDERTTMVAGPGGGIQGGIRNTGVAEGRGRASNTASSATQRMPIVHVLIPSDFRTIPNAERGTAYDWENISAGLDGIAIDLPAMNMKPTHGDVIPMNIRVKDPLWPMRDMLDFNFSVKPGEAHTLSLDTRDRILPNSKSLYLTISSASSEFGSASVEGAEIRLIFKPYKDALPEHIADRLTQVRDNYANMTEESVSSRRLNLFNRFDADITDLLRVDPENDLGRKYWNEKSPEQIRPPFTLAKAPAGVPEWAFLQVKDLGMLKDLINWYIDNRQITNGEFGGGLSDDSDFLNWWPGLAMMGADPDKLKHSLLRTLDEMYRQDMFENGLAKAQYDELHAYEDGINVLGESMLIDFGNPKEIERAMVTAKRLEWLTGKNSAGQTQIRSSFYSGTKMATGGVWGWAKNRSYFVYHPALELVQFNGTPETKKMVLETADGFLAHYRADRDGGRPQMHLTVNFKTNEDLATSNDAWFVLWAAYRWTGDKKYIAPFLGDPLASLRQVNADGLHIMNLQDTVAKDAVKGLGKRSEAIAANEPANQLAWQVTGDTSYLNKVYASQIQTATEREFINREGSLWIDRIYFNNAELQRARLGGVALTRGNDYPGNVVSWRFAAPANEQSVAILVPIGTPDHVKIIAYNLESSPVTAKMTGWEIDPGKWEITQGTCDDDKTDATHDISKKTESFERSASLNITFAPHTTTVIELKLVEKGVPYWSRPDLGISSEDVKVDGNRMKVTVHSLGAVNAPASKVVLRDKEGKTLASANAPALKAPSDLLPKTAEVVLNLPAKADWRGGSVTIESNGGGPEITMMNNRVDF